MGNYNPNTPVARGMETRYSQGFHVPALNPLAAAQLRIRPDAGTILAVHLCLLNVRGAPGLHLAVVDEQQPALTFTDFYPGSDTSAVTTGFEDQAAGAVNAVDVNDPNDDTDFATFATARGFNDFADLQFRGNNAGALAGRRIARVQLQALIWNRRIIGTAPSQNALTLPVEGAVVIDATRHKGNRKTVPRGDAYTLIPDLADWMLNPATGLPWAAGEVDDLIDATDADTFGLRLWGKSDDAGARVSAYWLRVWHTDENRVGFLDKRGSLRRGWDRYVLGSTSAQVNDTHYWVELAPLTATIFDNFEIGALLPLALPATDPTDDTSDHRQASGVILTGPGGPAQEGADKIATSQVQGAFLLERSGPTIIGESQPFTDVTRKFIGTFLGVNLRCGQQVTTDASLPIGGYAGVRLAVGWYDINQRPNRPLIIEVRSGVGAINAGGGVLEARATLIPEATASGEVQDVFVRFDGGAVVLATGTQYHVHLFSDALAAFGSNAWEVPQLDCRSDLVLAGSGTSVANVQGATQGGTTDSFFEGGVANDRYELPLALVGPPQPPTSITVTEFAAEPDASPGCPSTLPPRLRVQWPATNLGASFGGYLLFARRRALPIELPVLAAELGTTALLTDPAAAEDLLTEHWLQELGWGVTGAGYAEGWEIGIAARDLTTGELSAIRWTGVGNTPDPVSGSWITSDAARWLCTPLFVMAPGDADSAPLSEASVSPERAGGDHAIVRVSGTVPGRKYALRWESDTEYADESILRGARAAYLAGRQLALLRCRGDRALGAFTTDPSTHETDLSLSASADFVTTGSDPALAGPNVPAGFVLDGTADFVAHADTSVLDPDLAPFAFFVAGIFPDAANAVFMAKGNLGTSAAYGFRRNAAGSFQALVQGAGGTVSVADTSGKPYDGMYHVMWAQWDGTTLELWRDGAIVGASSGTVGSVTNALALTIGANNGGASGFAAIAPLNSWGVYVGALPNDDHVTASARYLLCHAGYRMAPGAAVFVDLRDKESFGRDGVLSDLAGNGLDATVTGSPPFRGVPWPLRDLERKR